MHRLTLPSAHRSRTKVRLGPLWLVAALLFVLSILVAPRTSAAGGPSQVAGSEAADLEAIQQAFQKVVEQVGPSVVGIRAQRCHLTKLPGADPEDTAGTLEQRVVINGSGTVITAEGLILTNEHVVRDSRDIAVLLHDGRQFTATVVGADPRSDLAILRAPCPDLAPVPMCDWHSVARGQWSIVLGNPFGLGNDGRLSVAIGVVSNLGRQLPGLGEVDDRFYNDMIQTTAPINPGHSGGPMFNVQGELIGIVTAMHTRAPADQGTGFAIPMTPAKRRLIATLCQGRSIEYGYLGLTARLPETEERDALGLAVGRGTVVQQVEPNGPAAKAKIRVGDLILRYQRQPVTGPAHLAELVGQTPVGARVRLELLRDGRPLTAQATVALRDVSRVNWMRAGAVFWRGMRLTDLTDDARRRMPVDGATHGVVVIDVLPNSPASRAGIRVGDVIEEVAGQAVGDTSEFLARVGTPAGALELSLRGRGARTIGP